MNDKTRKDYLLFRNAGYSPIDAIRNVRIAYDWALLDGMEFYGDSNEVASYVSPDCLVRIRAEYESESYFDVFGEPEGYTNHFGRWISPEHERENIIDMIERDGCYWLVSEYKDIDGEWQQSDSIGMNTGYSNVLDPLQNWYIPDLMRSAINHAIDVMHEQELNRQSELIEDVYSASIDY